MTNHGTDGLRRGRQRRVSVESGSPRTPRSEKGLPDSSPEALSGTSTDPPARLHPVERVAPIECLHSWSEARDADPEVAGSLPTHLSKAGESVVGIRLVELRLKAVNDRKELDGLKFPETLHQRAGSRSGFGALPKPVHLTIAREISAASGTGRSLPWHVHRNPPPEQSGISERSRSSRAVAQRGHRRGPLRTKSVPALPCHGGGRCALIHLTFRRTQMTPRSRRRCRHCAGTPSTNRTVPSSRRSSGPTIWRRPDSLRPVMLSIDAAPLRGRREVAKIIQIQHEEGPHQDDDERVFVTLD